LLHALHRLFDALLDRFEELGDLGVAVE